MDQADGKSVKLSNKIMVSSSMGDPMVVYIPSGLFFSSWNFSRSISGGILL